MVGQLHSHKGYNECTKEISVGFACCLVFFLLCNAFFSSCSLVFLEPESRLLCAYQACFSGTSKENWNLILSQTWYIDQERLLSSRGKKCLRIAKTAHACMVNEYLLTGFRLQTTRADWRELRQSRELLWTLLENNEILQAVINLLSHILLGKHLI